MHHKPEFIMLENVKGFDDSAAHQLLIDTLRHCGYRFEQFLLSPTQFSVPNSRQRYYLIARLLYVVQITNSDYLHIHKKIPVMLAAGRSIFDDDDQQLVDYIDHITPPELAEVANNHLEAYIDLTSNSDPSYQPSDEILLRYHMLFDFVDRHSTRSSCFTKAYAHRIEGCGSILKTARRRIRW
mgnify:CR=1 FL=1